MCTYTDHVVRTGYCPIDRFIAVDNCRSKPASEKFIFLLTTRVGGLGANLRAGIGMLYDSDWYVFACPSFIPFFAFSSHIWSNLFLLCFR